MEKLEYLTRMLSSRTHGKKYEAYVINALYEKIGNWELKPVTQQYVHNISDSRRYYLLDLYFPQINYGIEIDEGHHLSKDYLISDKEREKNILSAIQCEEGRISIFYPDGKIRSFEDIQTQIDSQVREIKRRIASLESLNWLSNEERIQAICQRGYVDARESDVEYGGISLIYTKIAGRNVSGLQRGFVKLNKKYYLWVPYLAIELEGQPPKTRNGFINQVNESLDVIKEIPPTVSTGGKNYIPSDEPSTYRLVFMKMKNRFGTLTTRFLGVFQYDPSKDCRIEDGRPVYHYLKVSDVVNIADLRKDAYENCGG